ncbi:translocation protein TolB [Anaplasma bovis]|uniref:translocation protein TolB n=1 Tax=Anaplasma bovis TaxID=186733 RepID=UPI002FF317F2
MRAVPLFFFVGFLFVYFDYAAAASLRLNVHSGGSADKVSVLVSPFRSSTVLERKIGLKCYEVVVNDLSSSGVFDVDYEIPYWLVAKEDISNSSTDFMSSLKHDILITGNISESSTARMRLSLFMLDVASGKELFGKSFNFEISNWRGAAHAISGEIYGRLTGDSGYFDSAVLYVAKSPTPNKICMMDSDGVNSTTIINSEELVSSPNFLPGGQKIVYASNTLDKSEVLVHNLRTGESTSIGQLDGNISSAQPSPRGKRVLLSRVLDGRTDIYSLDIDGGQFTKLTNGESVNTSASYSRDGRHIVFNSDRSGVPHLYVMNSDGSDQRRITSGNGMYASPLWSPRRDLIAFIKMEGGVYHIGIIGADGTGEKSLFKTTGSIEGLTWSPNGHVLLFVQKLDFDVPESEVHIVDLEGKDRKVTDIPVDISSPHWARLLRD